MYVFGIVFGFLVGLAVGSFLNVVAHRLPKGMSLLRPGSSCPACGRRIRARDNVPVVSYLALRGRCRSCRASIPRRYPLVEAATAALFAGLAATKGFDAELLLAWPLAAVLVAVTATDLEHRIVPNRVLAPAAAWALVATAIVDYGRLPEALIAGAAAGAGLFLIALVYPAGMGMGDVKLVAVLGLYLGLAVVPALFVAFASGGIVSVGILVRHGSAARKRKVPFAPFLAFGGVVGLFAGDWMIDWYVRSFMG